MILQNRRRDTDLNNKCMDTKGEGGCEEGIGRLGWAHVHYHNTYKQKTNENLQMVTAAMKLKDTYSLEGKLWPT